VFSIRGIFYLFATVFAVSSFPHCTSDTGERCIQGEYSLSDEPLPEAHAFGNYDCMEQAVPPSIEAWAGAADSVLYGTISRICPHMEPAVAPISYADPPYVSEAECHGIIEGGMQILLTDVQVIRGDDLGDEVNIIMGTRILLDHVPLPYAWSGGPITWVPQDQERKFELGQRIGAAMYVDPDLGFIGQKQGVFFQALSDDTVRFQTWGNDFCYAPVPDGLDGMDLDTFEERLVDLDLSDPNVQQEIAELCHWDEDVVSRLDQYWGAMCIPFAD
jgi:hypothetical protein